MKVIFLSYFALLFCIISIGCDHQNNSLNQDIRGVWRSDLDDSLLLVIYNRDLYVHDERGGDIYLNYSVKRDSLLLSQDNIAPKSNGKVIWNSNDEFFLINTKGKIGFTRIDLKVDTARLRTLVDWLTGGHRTYTEEYVAEHAKKTREIQAIWDSISSASR